MMLSVLSAAAVNASALTSGDYEYEILGDGTAEITKYNGSAENLTILTKIAGKTVTSIGDSAFSRNYSIKKVTLPDGVKNIGVCAFEYSTLTKITIPDSVTSIGNYAFLGCTDLKSVKVSKSVTDIGAFAFFYLWNGHFYELFPGCTLYVYKGSAAETYAKNEEYPTPFRYVDYFPDINKGDWYYDAAMYCSERLFITGYGNGRFGPADALQRQDFVVILARIAGADVSSYTSCALTDVDINAYYGKAVAWAVKQKIISGYQNGKFGVGDKITREQVATILYRYMNSPSVDTSVLNKFADKGNISEFAVNAMAWANANGVITGKNATTIAPTLTASRAEIATIIMRMDQKGMFIIT